MLWEITHDKANYSYWNELSLQNKVKSELSVVPIYANVLSERKHS